MSYWILPASGVPILCTTVQLVTEMEKRTNEFQEKMKQYDTKMNERIGDHVQNINVSDSELVQVLHEY